MKFDYNKLVQKVDAYLRKKRAASRLWAVMLPESLFRPELWLWEKSSVARGAAWGTSWALAPVPMQTIFAVLSSIRTRGNIPYYTCEKFCKSTFNWTYSLSKNYYFFAEQLRKKYNPKIV